MISYCYKLFYIISFIALFICQINALSVMQKHVCESIADWLQYSFFDSNIHMSPKGYCIILHLDKTVEFVSY